MNHFVIKVAKSCVPYSETYVPHQSIYLPNSAGRDVSMSYPLSDKIVLAFHFKLSHLHFN